MNEGDLVYAVPGNGCCGPNCAAAFLFHDEVFGAKLRIQMNKFQAKHWNRRYRFITQCSKGHPFVRKLKGGEVKFTEPEKLKKFLENSKKAAYMWTDSEDLAIISDMFQLKIKIITTKGPSDKNPSVNWISPDEKMAEYAELKNVELGEMVLLHENDTHFDLIVSKDSDLAIVGSLSNRFHVGPHVEETETSASDVEIDYDEDNYVTKNPITKILKRNLRIAKREIKSLKENISCVKKS